MVGLAFFMLAVALFNPSVPVVVGLFASDRHFGFACATRCLRNALVLTATSKIVALLISLEY